MPKKKSKFYNLFIGFLPTLHLHDIFVVLKDYKSGIAIDYVCVCAL